MRTADHAVASVPTGFTHTRNEMDFNGAFQGAENLPDDIVELLQEMGLTTKEVQIYEYLLNVGSATPSAIARDTAQPRGRIYEGMRNLVEKGFVRERPTRPIQFCPTPIAAVLAAAQARLSRHLMAVRKGQAAAAAMLAPQAVQVARPMRIRDVSVLSGRRACVAEIARMLETSTKFFWLIGGGRFSDRLAKSQSLLDLAVAAVGRGVDVRLMFPRPPALARSLAMLEKTSPSILRQLSHDPCGPVLACATEAASLEVLAQPDDDATGRGDDVAIHVNQTGFALRLRDRIASLLGEDRPTKPTPPVPWLGPDHGTDLFLEAIRNATSDVRVLGPPQWTEYMHATWRDQASVHRAASARGVSLRVVAADSGALRSWSPFESSWAIRCVPNVPMWLTIVDGRELFQAFPHDSLQGPPQFRRSTEPHEVAFYRDVFERLWGQATVALPRIPQAGAEQDRTAAPLVGL